MWDLPPKRQRICTIRGLHIRNERAILQLMLAGTLDGCPSFFGRRAKLFVPSNPFRERRVVNMVTYSDLFQYTLVLIGFAGLIIAVMNNTKK